MHKWSFIIYNPLITYHAVDAIRQNMMGRSCGILYKHDLCHFFSKLKGVESQNKELKYTLFWGHSDSSGQSDK